MVVPSPRPTTPSDATSRTISKVCPRIVVIDSSWGRIVGRSTRMVSTFSILICLLMISL